MMSDQEQAEDKSQNKREAILANRLSRQEREDLIHSLEHVVTVGSSLRRNAKRRKEWKNKQENTRETEDDVVVESNLEESGNQQPRPPFPPLMHAEDVRIYGKSGHRQHNWPTNKRKRKQKDNEWDIEHGDCIHPLAFLEARLSNVPPTNRQRIDGRNLSTDTTDCAVALDEVPQAMLARCWERAVHAASVSFDCTESIRQQAHGTASLPSAAGYELGAVEPEQEKDSNFSPEKAKQKCRDLGIKLKYNIGQQSCPVCGTVLDSSDDLDRHFYGRKDPSQQGCCWKKIRLTQYQLLNQVLQQEVKEAADGVVKSVMLSLDTSVSQEETDTEAPKVSNWQDILTFLESTCESATVGSPSTSVDGLLETIQYEPCKGPIVLNHHVLKNSRQRLVDRYADMPP